jgi:hypothetical protein
MKLTLDTLKDAFAEDAPPEVPEDMPSSGQGSESGLTDPAPYRGGDGDSSDSGPVRAVTKKERDEIATMIADAIGTAGLLVSFKCETCAQTIGGSADDIGQAAARYISGKPRIAAKMLSGGMDTLDLLVLVSTVLPVIGAVIHHHLPGMGEPPQLFDPLAPETPWQQ